MRQIVKRAIQKATSWYGIRKGFKFFHKGVDLRIVTDVKRKKLNIALPEDCIFKRVVWQKKWGYTFVFKGMESGVTLKFSHMKAKDFTPFKLYEVGFNIGQTTVTPHMVKNKFYDHLHFETWKNLKPFNPEKYFKKMGINYE